MHFEPGALYHIYNRSNETIFYNRDNYLFFLKKIKQKIAPNCRILAWVLLPNHFHFLVEATDEGCLFVEEQHRQNLQLLSKSIGVILSSYSQAINKQENRRGKLFSNNTEAKCLNDIEFENTLQEALSTKRFSTDFAATCFHYIHQNPVMTGLVPRMEDWEFSSYRDFTGTRNGTLVDRERAFEYVNLDIESFKSLSQFAIDESILKKLF